VVAAAPKNFKKRTNLMKATLALLMLPAALCLAQEETAHKNELAFGLGGIPALTQSTNPGLDAGSGVAFQVNYGRRFVNGHIVAFYGELNFVASPLRNVASSVRTATHDFASLYLTPGLRIKFRSESRLSPYVIVGGGYGDYEQSVTRLDGSPNQASRELARGVFDFGAGVDVHFWRFLSLRGEVRDFYTGAPNYNVASVHGGQHNIVATGAIVLGWH
jgi:opacity protein-like surface antigen